MNILPLARPVGIALLVVAGVSGVRAEAPALERTRYLMGTLLTARLEDPDSARAEAALEDALGEVARLEAVMSSWRDDSELARLNRAAAPFRCSPDLFAVLDSARALAAETDGAFDPTTEPLTRAWDLRGAGREPDARTLAGARARVGWRNLRLDPANRTARLASGAEVDLGGIGKGYALDRMVARLRERGVPAGWIDFGGEVRVFGPGRWVDVAHPADRDQPVVSLRLGDGAVSTSGQSERFVRVGGRRRGHVLDPRTGRPVDTAASVTVVAASGTRADALSTALLVLGREAAAGFARAHPGVGVLWLEPGAGGVRAWAWNLPHDRLARAGAVAWQTPGPGTAPGRSPRKGSSP